MKGLEGFVVVSVRLRVVVAISVAPPANGHPLFAHKGHLDPVLLAVDIIVLKKGGFWELPGLCHSSSREAVAHCAVAMACVQVTCEA